MTRQLAFIFAILFISSCSYKIRTLTTSDNKKIRVRYYEDDTKQEAYENKFVFKKHYSKMTFEKFTGKIIYDTTETFAYFQFDSVRIYIDKIPRDGNKGLKYADLFSSGLIYPKIISCALNNVCIIPQDSTLKPVFHGDTLTTDGIYKSFDKDFLKKRYDWVGSKVYISSLKELPYLEKSTTRVFEIGHKIYHGGPTNEIYFLEITNDKANKSTSLNDFIKGSRLNFLKHIRTYREI